MASVTLSRKECEEGELPSICMRCGEPAMLIKKKLFTWMPAWVMLLLVFGAVCFGTAFPKASPVALILIPVLRKKMRVPVPLCERHRNHWLPLQGMVLFGGIGVLLLFFSTFAFFIVALGHNERISQLVERFWFGTFVFLIIMVFSGAILQTRLIRPTKINSQSITLTNVAKRFIESLPELRIKRKVLD
jgi:hypothetical protein